jgi:hypothetical protein
VTKAFSRVWHLGLLHKLKGVGLSSTLLEWFKSYLSNRKQKVVIGGQVSELLELLAGVPEGSILGPLLFLIFINDLQDNIVSKISLYADDTILLHAYNDRNYCENTLNNDLKQIEKWSLKWLVDFNPLKTTFINISFKKQKTKLELKFKGENITQVTEHKHLGLIFSDDMKWIKHISYVTAKATKIVGQMYRSSIHLNRNQLTGIFLKMIRPILEYGSIIYDNCSFGDSKKLENVQRRAALICTGAMRRTETRKIMQLLGWPSLENRRKQHKIVMFFKIYNNLTPLYLSESIQCKVTKTTLRNKKIISIVPPKTRLTCYRGSFFPTVINEWNNLPDSITNVVKLVAFQSMLSMHKNPEYKIKSTCPMFSISSGFYGRILLQIKLGLSKLNHHLFEYNITDNPFCPKCLDSIEDTKHYFLNCLAYTNPRKNLLNAMQVCLNKCELSINSPDEFIFYILNGIEITDNNYSKKANSVNRELFNIVKMFMISTERFIKV